MTPTTLTELAARVEEKMIEAAKAATSNDPWMSSTSAQNMRRAADCAAVAGHLRALAAQQGEG